MLLGTSLDLHFLLAVVNVTCSIALYSQVAHFQLHGIPMAMMSIKVDLIIV